MVHKLNLIKGARLLYFAAVLGVCRLGFVAHLGPSYRGVTLSILTLIALCLINFWTATALEQGSGRAANLFAGVTIVFAPLLLPTGEELRHGLLMSSLGMVHTLTQFSALYLVHRVKIDQALGIHNPENYVGSRFPKEVSAKVNSETSKDLRRPVVLLKQVEQPKQSLKSPSGQLVSVQKVQVDEASELDRPSKSA